MAKSIRAIDRVTEAYAGKRKKTVVEEWGGLECWASPLTSQDRIDANAQVKIRYGDDEEAWPIHVPGVFLVIQKLEDKDGEKLFKFSDATDLLNKGEAVVIDRLLVWIYGGGGLSLDEAGKGSAKTETESDSSASSGKS